MQLEYKSLKDWKTSKSKIHFSLLFLLFLKKLIFAWLIIRHGNERFEGFQRSQFQKFSRGGNHGAASGRYYTKAAFTWGRSKISLRTQISVRSEILLHLQVSLLCLFTWQKEPKLEWVLNFGAVWQTETNSDILCCALRWLTFFWQIWL